MSTADERMRILNMIRDGKLSADEGTRLIQALNLGAKKAAAADRARGTAGRWLRVSVTELKSNKSKVSVNLPMSLVNVGIKLGARFVPSGENDFSGVLESIRAGAVGKVFEYEDVDEGERIEIWVE
jgi:hypothetical protein